MVTTAAYDPQKFSLETKKFERQSYDLAVSKAKELAQDKTSKASVLPHGVSRKICNEAFETFKKNIQTTFPNDVYKELVLLTLISREGLFFIDLKERVISILRNPEEQM